MDNHTEFYLSESVALMRGKDLSKRFPYVIIIKDRLNRNWIHTTRQELDGDKIVLELIGEDYQSRIAKN